MQRIEAMRKALIVGVMCLPLAVWAQNDATQNERTTLDGRSDYTAAAKTSNSQSQLNSQNNRVSSPSFATLGEARQSRHDVFGQAPASQRNAATSEPGAYMLTLAGIAVVAFIARRLNRS
jgi:hypothetical protein